MYRMIMPYTLYYVRIIIMPYMFTHVNDDYAIYSTMNIIITMCMLIIPYTFYHVHDDYAIFVVDNAIYVYHVNVEYAIYVSSSDDYAICAL